MTTELFLGVTAAISGFGVLITAVIAIYRTARRIGDALGVDEKGRTVSDRLDRVEHQLWENGGSSLADRVNNIENHVVKVSTEIDFIKELTIGMHASQTGSNDLVQPLKKPVTRKKKSS